MVTPAKVAIYIPIDLFERTKANLSQENDATIEDIEEFVSTLIDERVNGFKAGKTGWEPSEPEEIMIKDRLMKLGYI